MTSYGRQYYRRWAVTAALCALAVAYSLLSLRTYAASLLSASGDLRSIERAIALEPRNAQHYHRLARHRIFTGGDTETAIADLERALALKPQDAHIWLDLGLARMVTGRERHQEAVLRAVALNPADAEVAWSAANMLIVEGEFDHAAPLLRTAMLQNPSSVRQAVDLAWRATNDIGKVLPLVSKSPAAQIALLESMVRLERLQESQEAWRQIVAENTLVQPQRVFPYIEFLLAKNDSAAASTAWSDLTRMDAQLSRYAFGEGLVNGSFEEPLLHTGLDWRVSKREGVRVEVDRTEWKEGAHSLALTFDADTPAAPLLVQRLTVQPETEYELSAWFKSMPDEGAGAPALVLTDAANATLAASDPLRAAIGWRKSVVRFRTAPGQSLLTLSVQRRPADKLYRGRLWLDAVTLQPVLGGAQ